MRVGISIEAADNTCVAGREFVERKKTIRYREVFESDYTPQIREFKALGSWHNQYSIKLRRMGIEPRESLSAQVCLRGGGE